MGIHKRRIIYFHVSVILIIIHFAFMIFNILHILKYPYIKPTCLAIIVFSGAAVFIIIFLIIFWSYYYCSIYKNYDIVLEAGDYEEKFNPKDLKFNK